MLDDTININGKDYEIKNKLTLGLIKKINKSFRETLGQDAIPDLTLLPDDEVIKLRPKILEAANFNEVQLELCCELIKHTFGMDDADLDKIPFDEVEAITKKIVEANQPKKKSNPLSG